jgi:hypothetical protein
MDEEEADTASAVPSGGASSWPVILMLVPLFLLAIRQAGTIRGVGLREALIVGLILIVPSLVDLKVAATLSIALNIALILHVQELTALVDSRTVPSETPSQSSDGVDLPNQRRRDAAQQRPAAASAAAASSSSYSSSSLSSSSSSSSSSSAASTQSPPPSSPSVPPASPAAPSSTSALAARLPKFTQEERETLASGAMLMREVTVACGPEGYAAQRINAPADLVWATLLDFGEWPRMIDDVVSASVYEREGSDIKVHVTIGVGFLKVHTYVHHTLDRVAGTLTWLLDGTRSSDLLSNSGYWMVRESAEAGPKSRPSCTVVYSCAVQLRSWAPRWLDRYIAREGLPRALGWLKRESERRAMADLETIETMTVHAAAEGITSPRTPQMARTGGMHRRSASSPNLAELEATLEFMAFGRRAPAPRRAPKVLAAAAAPEELQTLPEAERESPTAADETQTRADGAANPKVSPDATGTAASRRRGNFSGFSAGRL